MAKEIWGRITKYLFNGMITILPLLVTLWLLIFIFTFADNFLGSYITDIFGISIPGQGILLTLLIFFVVGFLTTHLFGKQILGQGEKILYKLPVVNTIYSSVKQVNELLFLQKETKAFRKVCAVEYPRKGVWAIGFVTGNGPEDIAEATKTDLYTVFVPTSPTPATGYVVAFPKKDVIMLDMRLEDAVKLLVSGGVLSPKKRQIQQIES
ncbi:MAG: DUF502 domain-containing protein [Candidatus Margulisbacteria bacterium]|nr:DUF502 domain-containing protein [Candidatus Margulisiibacteriota bacterium]MBU1021558.1 DUF502 domain-containing protein [Candidatus Margulisiibacteriota bacterium]MBU1728709.1 DUF502 domain-containing protein [Candidatus Margulisiibacteriota bacterium]MBU1955160.1 DUF502 domain-containing protein [Candidatus Margulisiibacteriota bacterium]